MFKYRILKGRNTSGLIVKLISTNPVNFQVTNTKLISGELLSETNEKYNAAASGWEDAKPLKEIPGPKGIPLLGNTWRFFPFIGNFYGLNQLELFQSLHQYGDVVMLRGVGGKDIAFIFNPEHIGQIFRNEGTWPIRNVFQTLVYYTKYVRNDAFQGMGTPATTQGKEWYDIRSKINPVLMQPRSVELYIPEMNHVAEDFLERIRHLMSLNGKAEMPENFANELNKWALESVCFIALDKRLGCLVNDLKPESEAQKAIDAGLVFFDLLFELEFRPSLWKIYSTRKWKRLVQTLNCFVDIFLKNIKEAQQNYKHANIVEDKKSMLQKLLDIDEKLAIATAIELLTAGVDTTGKSMGAILYFVSTNKKVQDRLREELKTFLPKKDSPITKEALSHARYLKAVVKEGQRLASIAIGTSRTATKDMVIGGYQIPTGTELTLCNAIPMLSEEHFPRPSEFLPERWLRDNKGELSYRSAHPFVYLPFGFGPRSCLGKHIALMEIRILLAKVIRNFEISWPHPPARFSSTLLYAIADPLKFHFKEVEE